MGISGLLPLLKSIHRPCNLKKFAGETIGVDAYGWLHRGTVACAVELALDKPTRKFVDFAMHRVRMLQHFGVTPFLVFDGDYLPSKAATEDARSQRREESKRRGLELQRLGKSSQAYLELQKAIDVTPEMARQLIDELKKTGVQYIVAPYEADAQLVYLERKGIVSGILSEDSDLLVFGAKRLLTKLDQYGECIEINRKDFTSCKSISLTGWSDAEFRLMAILSGCDYLASINKMGLKTAYRLVRKHKTIERIIQAIQFEGQLRIPAGYLGDFKQAELTFLHQRVFCPIKEAVVMHTDPDKEVDDKQMPFIGQTMEDDIAVGVACGDLHPMTKEPLVVKSTRRSIIATPRNAQGRWPMRANSTGGPDLKGGKVTIEQFFKKGRTPLAELDPNSFTPSPTQQRNTRRFASTSWTAVTAPTSASPTLPPTPLVRSQTSPATQTWTIQTEDPVPRPIKRARLCADEFEALDSPGRVEEVRSRFFAAPSDSIVGLPKLQEDSRRRSGKADINIFSDDSIEDAMIHLPDVGERIAETNPVRMKILDERTLDIVAAPTSRSSPISDEPCRGSSTHDQLSSTTTGMVDNQDQPDSSADCAFDDVVAAKLDSNATGGLQNLGERFAFQPNRLKSEDAQSSPIVRKLTKASTLSQSPSGPPLRQTNSGGIIQKNPKTWAACKTPLQRLGLGALKRFKPSSADTPTWSKAAGKDPDPEASPAQDTHSHSQGEDIDASSTIKPVPSVRIVGSEDMRIPDSEEDDEEDDESNELLELDDQGEGEGHRIKLQLGSFIFTGR